MITAYGDADTKRKALENGADALLTKPIDFVTLRSEIALRVERALLDPLGSRAMGWLRRVPIKPVAWNRPDEADRRE